MNSLSAMRAESQCVCPGHDPVNELNEYETRIQLSCVGPWHGPLPMDTLSTPTSAGSRVDWCASRLVSTGAPDGCFQPNSAAY